MLAALGTRVHSEFIVTVLVPKARDQRTLTPALPPTMREGFFQGSGVHTQAGDDSS